MDLLQSLVLGVVEGLTEFLPVSSTGHLMITEKILGMQIDDKAVGAYTAVIQLGAIAAVVVYFGRDLWRILRAWVAGLTNRDRRVDPDYGLAWAVIVGSLPIGVVGLAGKHVIEGPFKSLWVVAGALIVWSAVMVFAERRARQERGVDGFTMRDALVMGLMQCIALVPGVSRSGATISAGLLSGLDRVAATRMAFYLGIPALTAAGLYEMKDVSGISAGPAIVGTVVAFLVAYASIAWLLQFVAHHSIGKFAPYRVALGLVLVGLLATNVMSAT